MAKAREAISGSVPSVWMAFSVAWFHTMTGLGGGVLSLTSDSYDAAGHKLSETLRSPSSQVLRSTAMTYDLDGNVMSTTDGDGNVTLNTYDAAGNVATEEVIDAKRGPLSLSSMTYDA